MDLSSGTAHETSTLKDKYFSPEVLSPKPVAPVNLRKTHRPIQKAVILTSTPYKDELKSRKEKKSYQNHKSEEGHQKSYI